jgi:hypothetical protein
MIMLNVTIMMTTMQKTTMINEIDIFQKQII